MFISIAGNIGLGKTTLAKIIAKEWNFGFSPEKIGDDVNPFWKPFYEDIVNGVKPSKNAYDLQMRFLELRSEDHRKMQESSEWWVQDRSIYEDPLIYAVHLNTEGFLSDGDYERYLTAFEEVNESLEYPNLMIHLLTTPDVARERIKMRARPEEMHLVSLDNSYLDKLYELYTDFSAKYHGKALLINPGKHNIKESEEERECVLALIRKNTPGLNRKDIVVNGD
jgi:deoxyadenosine/deoxycytidine kinase